MVVGFLYFIKDSGKRVLIHFVSFESRLTDYAYLRSIVPLNSAIGKIKHGFNLFIHEVVVFGGWHAGCSDSDLFVSVNVQINIRHG